MLIPALFRNSTWASAARPEREIAIRSTSHPKSCLKVPHRHDCRRWPPHDRTAASHSEESPTGWTFQFCSVASSVTRERIEAARAGYSHRRLQLGSIRDRPHPRPQSGALEPAPRPCHQFGQLRLSPHASPLRRRRVPPEAALAEHLKSRAALPNVPPRSEFQDLRSRAAPEWSVTTSSPDSEIGRA